MAGPRLVFDSINMRQEAWETGTRILPITDSLHNFGMIIELILCVTRSDAAIEREPVNSCEH